MKNINELSMSIVGKGIGGLTLAYALERAGYNNFKIYEQSKTAKEFAKGSGIILACNAMQIMKKLGLHEELQRQGHILQRMNITNENLKVLSRANIRPFSELYNVNTVAIHRERLHDIISSKIKSETFLRKRLDKINLDHSQLNMIFEDATRIHSDIIIGADGLNSKVRNNCFPEVKFRDAGQICWRGIANIEMTKYQHELNEIWGKGKRFGFVKINKYQVYWYALKNSNNTNCDSVTVDELNDLYSDFHPDILDIINSTEEDTIITRPIFDFKTPEKWYKKGVCLIGDAAHAMTPNLGQGACQAIEDAYILSECLKKYKSEQAFEKFNEIRGNKASWIVERSRMFGKMSQINYTAGIWIRNAIMSVVPSQLAYRDTKKILDIYSL